MRRKSMRVAAAVLAGALILGTGSTSVFASTNTEATSDATIEMEVSTSSTDELVADVDNNVVATADEVPTVEANEEPVTVESTLSASNADTSADEKTTVENTEATDKKLSKKTAGKDLISGQSVVNYACKFIGNPYRYGGTSLTKGTDCSGFVMSVYKEFGIKLPHSSSSMRRCGKKVSLDKIQPGDIVCYSGHVAIYAGNGKIVHASTPRTGIKMGKLKYKRIICVRRVL